MDRFSLTDAQWAKMERHCLGKPGDRGRTGGDNRLFVEAVLWIARTGSHRAAIRPPRGAGTPKGVPEGRDLPPWFGKWNTAFKRFRDRVRADVFQRLFDAVSDEPDMEYAMVDATIVRVHRHGQGAKGGLRARP